MLLPHLEWQRPGGCCPDDARSDSSSSVTDPFPTLMSARPTFLAIPDELFIKILSLLDFLQLIRSQLVRYFCHSLAIRAQHATGLQTFRPYG